MQTMVGKADYRTGAANWEPTAPASLRRLAGSQQAAGT
jgi:hypothetical protein